MTNKGLNRKPIAITCPKLNKNMLDSYIITQTSLSYKKFIHQNHEFNLKNHPCFTLKKALPTLFNTLLNILNNLAPTLIHKKILFEPET